MARAENAMYSGLSPDVARTYGREDAAGSFPADERSFEPLGDANEGGFQDAGAWAWEAHMGAHQSGGAATAFPHYLSLGFGGAARVNPFPQPFKAPKYWRASWILRVLSVRRWWWWWKLKLAAAVKKQRILSGLPLVYNPTTGRYHPRIPFIKIIRGIDKLHAIDQPEFMDALTELVMLGGVRDPGPYMDKYVLPRWIDCEISNEELIRELEDSALFLTMTGTDWGEPGGPPLSGPIPLTRGQGADSQETKAHIRMLADQARKHSRAKQ